MKKNNYNFPRRATNSNNPQYNQYVEDMYFDGDYPHPQPKRTRGDNWRKNGITDMYHDELDDGSIYQDPYTVAQHFYDRTTMPYG